MSSGTATAVVSSNSKTADASMRSTQRPQRVEGQGLGRLRRCAPLRGLDELTVLVEQSSWLVSIGSTRPSERTATSAIACGSRSELM